MMFIIGLGNPGPQFNHTRHNAGFEVLDFFAEKNGFPEFKPKHNGFALISERGDVTLIKPQTFMNDSGKVADFYKYEIPKLVVVHDDIDLPLGSMKFSQGSGAGGHKGVASIIQHLGNNNFIRLKIGVATDERRAEEVVLQKFSPDEQKVLQAVIEKASDALDYLIEHGIEKTMNEYHRQ